MARATPCVLLLVTLLAGAAGGTEVRADYVGPLEREIQAVLDGPGEFSTGTRKSLEKALKVLGKAGDDPASSAKALAKVGKLLARVPEELPAVRVVESAADYTICQCTHLFREQLSSDLEAARLLVKGKKVSKLLDNVERVLLQAQMTIHEMGHWIGSVDVTERPPLKPIMKLLGRALKKLRKAEKLLGKAKALSGKPISLPGRSLGEGESASMEPTASEITVTHFALGSRMVGDLHCQIVGLHAAVGEGEVWVLCLLGANGSGGTSESLVSMAVPLAVGVRESGLASFLWSDLDGRREVDVVFATLTGDLEFPFGAGTGRLEFHVGVGGN
jgi:hypothetical protein